MSEIIIGSANDLDASGKLINSSDQIAAKEAASEEVVRMLKSKALAFDMLFYLTCLNATGKVAMPKNKTKYNNQAYNKLIQICKALCGVDVPEHKKTYITNIETYMDFILEKMKSGDQ